jgi:hypothetical protein
MRWKSLLVIQLGFGFMAATGLAEVVRFEIVEVESPTFEGRRFGSVGAYEKLIIRATLEVDPEAPRNAGIVDLAAAPRNAAGHVEFIADVVLLKPVDLERGNRRIFYDVLNRGEKIGLNLMNDGPWEDDPTTAEDAGNGFLMRQGYTIVWSGWQGDLGPGEKLMRLTVPVAKGITGPSRDEFIFDDDINPVVATLSYPAADMDPTRASLTVRQQQTHPRQSPDDLSFEYFRVSRSGISYRDPRQILIQRPAGFDAGAIYEIVYPARDPVVMGLAFASVRDVVAFLRRQVEDSVGNPNPLAPNGAPLIERAYALGISQSGRFLRDLLYQGFNEDEEGLVVFDALIPDVAGGRKTYINHRFAQPGRYSRQHEEHLQPGDQFPFTYGITTDSLTGKRDGVLARCQRAGSCPKIMHVDSSTEFFQARSSLVVTDTDGKPIELPGNVRAYLISGTQHSARIDALSAPTRTCQQPSNPLHKGGPMRALLVALDRWVTDGVEPPVSRFPTISDGTLVAADRNTFGLPAIPGLRYQGQINRLHVVDYDAQPPPEGAAYPLFVPAVDDDGNDIAGIRLPAVEVPVATYLGWNLRRAGYAEGALCAVTGSSIAFPRDRQERLATGDPRLSIAERYTSHEDYVRQLAEAAHRLLQQGLLLPEDVQRMIDRGIELASLR